MCDLYDIRANCIAENYFMEKVTEIFAKFSQSKRSYPFILLIDLEEKSNQIYMEIIANYSETT